jgi:hypothetical protein
MFQTITLDNRLNMQKTFTQKGETRPLSRVGSSKVYIKKAKIEENNLMAEKLINSKMDKPALTCGAKNETEEEKFLEAARLNKSKNLGRNRMVFKGSLGENEIKNFVNLTPSRPVSAYKFREVDKARWMNDKNFFLS